MLHEDPEPQAQNTRMGISPYRTAAPSTDESLEFEGTPADRFLFVFLLVAGMVLLLYEPAVLALFAGVVVFARVAASVQTESKR